MQHKRIIISSIILAGIVLASVGLQDAKALVCGCPNGDEAELDIVFILKDPRLKLSRTNITCWDIEEIVDCFAANLGVPRENVRDTIFSIVDSFYTTRGDAFTPDCLEKGHKDPIIKFSNYERIIEECPIYVSDLDDWGGAVIDVLEQYPWRSTGRCPAIIVLFVENGPIVFRQWDIGDWCNKCDSLAIGNICDWAHKNNLLIVPVTKQAINQNIRTKSCFDWAMDSLFTCTRSQEIVLPDTSQIGQYINYLCNSLTTMFTSWVPRAVDLGNDTIICAGHCATITATPRFGVPPYRYAWTPDYLVSNATAQTVVACPENDVSRYFVVQVTDGNGCIGRDSAFVSVSYIPNMISLEGENFVCLGNCIDLNVLAFKGDPPFTYVWTPDHGLTEDSASHTLACPTVNVTYKVIVTDSGGCKAIDSLKVEVGKHQHFLKPERYFLDVCLGECIQLTTFAEPIYDHYSYSWDPKTWLNSNLYLSPTSCPLRDIKYTCWGKAVDGCWDTASIEVTVHPKVEVDINQEIRACQSNYTQIIANVSGGTAPFSYLWEPRNEFMDPKAVSPLWLATRNGYVYVTVTDDAGCTARDSQYAYMESVIPVRAKGPKTVCLNEQQFLTVDHSNCATWTKWYLDDVLVFEGDRLPIPTNEKGHYKFIVRDSCANGCFSQDSIQVDVVGIDEFAIETRSWDKCKGISCFTITAVGVEEPAIIHWDLNGDREIDNSSNVETEVCFYNMTAGKAYNITATVSDRYGCKASSSAILDAPVFCCNDSISGRGKNYPACLAVQEGMMDLCTGRLQFLHYSASQSAGSDTISSSEKAQVRQAFQSVAFHPNIYPINTLASGYPSVHKVMGFDAFGNAIESLGGAILLAIHINKAPEVAIDKKLCRMFILEDDGWSLVKDSWYDESSSLVYGAITELNRIYAILGFRLPTELMENLSLVPSPVTDNLILHYTLTEAANINLELYDTRGRIVYSDLFVKGSEGTSGEIQGEWNTMSLDFKAITSGIYFLHIIAEAEVRKSEFIEKIAIIK